MPLRSLLLILCLITHHARSQDTAAILQELAEAYAESKQVLMKPVTELQDLYAGKLEELRKQATAAGQLEEVLSIKSELDSFRSSDTPAAPDSLPKLQQLQRIFRDALPARLQQANTALAPLTASYQTQLQTLQAQLTQQDKLTEALQVKAVLDALNEASTQLTQAAPSSAALQLTAPGAGLGSALTFKQGKLHYLPGNQDGNPILDITTAEGISDFVDVAAEAKTWAALRSDGTVVGWKKGKGAFQRSGVTKLIQRFAAYPAGIDQNGSIVNLIDGSIMLDAGGGPNVIDAAVEVVHQNIALLEDGTVKVWGRAYETPPYPSKKFPAPPPEGLKDIVSIGAARYAAWTVNRRGDFFGWGEGEWVAKDLPREMRQATQVWGLPTIAGLIEIKGKEYYRFKKDGGRLQVAAKLDLPPSVIRCCEHGAIGLVKGKWTVLVDEDLIGKIGLQQALEKGVGQKN